MIVFPNAKINLGLNIVAKRPDGYHDLDMVMFPVNWCDILEIVPSHSGHTTLTVTGRAVDCPMEKNLVYKAWRRLSDAVEGNLPPVDIYLHKIIPDGAGLGGGSSDAAFTLKALNELFALGFLDKGLADIAATIGADCPFFIYNRPMHCTATGTTMTTVDVDLQDASHIVIAKPDGISVSTAEAYSRVQPKMPVISTDNIVSSFSPFEWSGKLKNDFEKHIFEIKPEIALVKQTLVDAGAVYASMSGSGSAVFGLFDDEAKARHTAAVLSGCIVYRQ